MDTFRVLYRYVSGDQEGMIGKVLQHTDQYTGQDLPQDADELERSLVRSLDRDPVAAYRGTVGVVFRSSYRGSEVSIKAVMDSTRRSIESEQAAANLMGLFGPAVMGEIARSASAQLDRELDMRHELDACRLVRKRLSGIASQNRVEFLKPVRDLCSPRAFVYHHVNALPLETACRDMSPADVLDVCRRIVRLYFGALHHHGVLLGDLNLGNFLYRSSTLVVIDYGCVVRLDRKGRKVAADMHLANDDIVGLRKLVIEKWNGTEQMVQMIHQQAQPFYRDHACEFEKMPLRDPRLMKMKLPPEALPIIRASTQLLQIMRRLGVRASFAEDVRSLGI